jgi:hypothetical protein
MSEVASGNKRDWLERVLGIQLEGGSGAAADNGLAERAAMRSRLKAATPAIETAVRRNGASAGQIRNLARTAGELMLGPGFDPAQAAALLDRIDALLAESADAPPGLSLVKLGKSRIEWAGLRDRAHADIERLQSALLDEFRDDDEQQPALAKAIGALDGVIEQLNADLENQLDAVLNAADPAERGKLIATAKTTMNRFTGFVTGDPVMSKLDGNEILPDLKVTGPLTAKLQEISASLG